MDSSDEDELFSYGNKQKLTFSSNTADFLNTKYPSDSSDSDSDSDDSDDDVEDVSPTKGKHCVLSFLHQSSLVRPFAELCTEILPGVEVF